MIKAIYAYGSPVLKRRAQDIDLSYPGLDILIKDMEETMKNAHGVGLAAPQVGLSIRLFIIDTTAMYEEEPERAVKKVFINPTMIEESGKEWKYEEGCLSIPDITGDVSRKEKIKLRYVDAEFQELEEEFDGLNARVIQHEYDHLEGILFTEKLPPIKKRRIKKRMNLIKTGNIETRYKMKFTVV